MVRVVDEYARALLQRAVQQNAVEDTVGHASRWLSQTHVEWAVRNADLPKGVLAEFMAFLEVKDREGDADGVLNRFIELAMEQMGVVHVEVVSAAPLTAAQQEALQRKLIARAGKRVHLACRTDPSLIAGLRISSGGVVMDTSVKRQLADMREKLYKGGLFTPWTQ